MPVSLLLSATGTTLAQLAATRNSMLLLALLPATADAKCVDTLSQCAAWAAHGECESNAAYMEHACAKSCGKCGGADGTNATPTTPRPAAGRLQHPAAAAMVEAAAAELAKADLEQQRGGGGAVRSAPPLAQGQKLPPPSQELPPAVADQHQQHHAAAAAPLPSGGGGAANATEVLARAREQAAAAARDLRECRAARGQCAQDLARCQAGESAHAKAEQVLHGEEERCVDELQKTREAYKQRLSEDNELRVRLETEQGRTRDASSALAALQLQCSPKAIDATCAQRTAKADATTLECRRRLDEAVRQVRGYKAKLDAQQLLEGQLGTLRQQLERHEQLEADIEGKHSKLTEVYKVLESECQVELAACRGGNATGSNGSGVDGDGTGGQQAAAAARRLAIAAAEEAGDCGGPSPLLEHWAALAGALLAGVVLGGALAVVTMTRLLGGGGSGGGGGGGGGGGLIGGLLRRPRVEELGGWMPTTVSVTLQEDMKLS